MNTLYKTIPTYFAAIFLITNSGCSTLKSAKQSEKISIKSDSIPTVIQLIEDKNSLLFYGNVCNKKAIFKFDNHVLELYSTKSKMDSFLNPNCFYFYNQTQKRAYNGITFKSNNYVLSSIELNNLKYSSVLISTINHLNNYDFLFGRTLMDGALWKVDFGNNTLIQYSSEKDIKDFSLFKKVGKKNLIGIFKIPIIINDKKVVCNLDLGYSKDIDLPKKTFEKTTQNIANIKEIEVSYTSVAGVKKEINSVYDNAPIIFNGNKVYTCITGSDTRINMVGLKFFRENYQSIILDFVNGGFYVLPK